MQGSGIQWVLFKGFVYVNITDEDCVISTLLWNQADII